MIQTIQTSELKRGDYVKAWLPKSPAADHHASRRGKVLAIHGQYIQFQAHNGKTYLTTKHLVREAWRSV